MRFPTPLVEGRLLRRYKRFLADVRLETGQQVTAHCPNPGSMISCLVEGGLVLLSRSDDPRRKLAWTWELAKVGRTWVLINTARANRVVEEALLAGRVEPLRGYPEVRAEVPFGEGSRADFRLRGPGLPDCFVEVKSMTLAEGRGSYFPDSVTLRGQRHLEELEREVARGHRAVLLFLVSRADTEVARPAENIDPDYADLLRRAAARGVEVLAYRNRCRRDGLRLERRLPVDLSGVELGPMPRGRRRPNRRRRADRSTAGSPPP